MPVWEGYEVEAETRVTVRAEGKIIASFATYGAAKGSSNEDINPGGMLDAIRRAVGQSSANSDAMGETAKKARRAELGCRDGD